MKYISDFGRKLEHLGSVYPKKSARTTYSLKAYMSSLFNYMVFHVKPFWVQLGYFLIVSLVGYLALKVSKTRTDYIPDDFDLFFTSASATTVASMSTVEMEVFSNAQLVIMTILIFLGGEIFISVLGLQFQRSKFWSSMQASSCVPEPEHTVELGIINLTPSSETDNPVPNKSFASEDDRTLVYNSLKALGCVVLGYLLIVHVLGASLVSTYINLTSSANNVLKSKGLLLQTFSVFTTVSTFTNCGFVPTNENMIAFRQNTGLLLILIPQGLLGGTLYPPCLRLVIWVLERFTKRKEYTYMLQNYKELGYDHLMSSKESWFLAGTVLVFLMLQFALFCIMEWSSGVMDGMSSYQKLVGSLFQTANSRHAGESIVDLSTVSSAILTLFVLMMYLPPYTSFLPSGDPQPQEISENNKSSINQKKKNIIQNMFFSQLSYLTIFVIVICITERKSMREDPLNFNVFNIVVEVVSAYGSVGFSTGYSCKRRQNLDESCVDKWYGFAGRWSKGGKITLILVMFYGRVKKFNMHGGKAWRVS